MNRVLLITAAPMALTLALASCKGGDASMSSPSIAAPPPPVMRDASAATPAIDAAPSPAPTTASSREERVALRKGRELARRHDWPAAVAAFDQATRAAPGDARALSELGWAAFRAGDLDRAETAAQAAAAIDGATARVRAASLYNLGRVKEARGDKDGAAEAYRASLALRRSRTVRRHLRALGRAHTAPAHDHEPQPASVAGSSSDDDRDPDDDSPVDGPFARPGDWCDAEAARDDGSAVTCLATSGLAAGAEVMATPPAPVRELRVVGMRGELDDVTCLLAFHLADGWYVWNGVPCETTTAAGTDWAASLAFVSPAAGRIALTFAIGVASRGDDNRAHHACQAVVVACAVDGARPACTAPIPYAWAASCPDAPTGAAPAIHWDEAADWSLDGDHLVVRAPSHARRAPDGLTDLAAARVSLR